MENEDLVDIWRILNPENGGLPGEPKRLIYNVDSTFFLISCRLCSDVENADILTGYKTDHSLATIKINTKSNPRGPGFWKLNTSLLSEVAYVD